MLDALFDPTFYSRYVKQPTPATIDRDLNQYQEEAYWPLTERCIGAVDGTHIKVIVRTQDQPRYRNRKGDISTNVLGCVDFAGHFTYVLAGWEGSLHDARVYNKAKEEDLAIPDGYWYLADAGYPSRSDLVIPFRGVRYHLQEWSCSGLRYVKDSSIPSLRSSADRRVMNIGRRPRKSYTIDVIRLSVTSSNGFLVSSRSDFRYV